MGAKTRFRCPLDAAGKLAATRAPRRADAKRWCTWRGAVGNSGAHSTGARDRCLHHAGTGWVGRNETVRPGCDGNANEEPVSRLAMWR